MARRQPNIPVYYKRIANDGPVLQIWPRHGADAILFYPGSMLSPNHYFYIIKKLWQAGLTVAGLHFAGHGVLRKEKPVVFSQMLQHGIMAQEWLMLQKGKRVAICGHSQGGILALAHAAENGKPLACFALGAVFPQMQKAINITRFRPFSAWRSQILKYFKLFARLFPEFPLPLPFYLELVKIIKGRTKPVYFGSDNGRLSYPARFLASLFDASIPYRAQCPFHLIISRTDALFTPELMLDVYKRIQCEGKRLLLLDYGGHMAPFNKSLAAFIARYMACECAGLGMELNSGLNHEI